MDSRKSCISGTRSGGGAEAEMVRICLEFCECTPVSESDAALVFSGANWHRGVAGIVASRLVERFCRPVFVLSEEDGQAQGSGRGIAAFHLLEALESMSDLLTRFGGHRQAAGLSLPVERVAEFRRRFNQYAAARLTPDDFVPRIGIDAVLSFPELDETAVEELLALAPFGCGNPAPILAARNVECFGPPGIFKEKHLRVNIRQLGRGLTATAWNFAARAAEFAAANRVDVAIRIEEDSYGAARGEPGWRVILKDARTAAAIQAAGSVK